ncbi:MAG TPA: 16S rRNA (cytosine(1402)-N(4))-methyltransferase RsmH [Candidatus Kapabacteria bacterium]|nr:16S rRNA (cytosine(1402)-N(4))-methyltransferase RsmH [Candidatus Kapabacteria bacterium]
MPEHIPVLKDEVADLLKITGGGIFFDGTVGLGGHSAAIMEACAANYLYGTDKDGEALEIAEKKLAPFKGRFTLFHGDFRNLKNFYPPLDIGKIDGFLFDLGVSSFQLDNPEKGFSYAKEAPLDMRMDKNQSLTAYEVVNNYTHEQLLTILKKYGELTNAARIVDQIVFHRKTKQIANTGELKTIIRRVAPQQKTMDPLARIFQAIRIEVNRELVGLEEFFNDLFNLMKPGARVVIISFHSLEDRIVKAALKDAKSKGIMTILTSKPVMARESELGINPRSRSAKLRAGERK